MDSELINILCYKLSGDVSRAVHNEYENRWREIKHIWDYPRNRFKVLEDYSKTVQHLLAMSTFYRRVLSGIDGACDFYKTISKNASGNREHSITIGKYRLNKEEYNKMLAIKITFRELRKKFCIDDCFFEYTETEEFLTNCKNLYFIHHNKPDEDIVSSKPDEDLPF